MQWDFPRTMRAWIRTRTRRATAKVDSGKCIKTVGDQSLRSSARHLRPCRIERKPQHEYELNSIETQLEGFAAMLSSERYRNVTALVPPALHLPRPLTETATYRMYVNVYDQVRSGSL
jgi:hypothetical protein